MRMLEELGVRSLPVVSIGKRYIVGQNTREVLKFLGLDAGGQKQLTPTELASRMDLVLETASRLIRQIPSDKLSGKLPNRDRTYRVLSHHIFIIPQSFLDVARGKPLTPDMLTTPPPNDMVTSAQIADFGDAVRRQVAEWWSDESDKSAERQLDTYYGKQRLNDVMERTTWHSAQHVRQIALVLETLGITPDRPLTPAQTAGLPLPEKVWDE
jgi:hypothetical protein